MELDEWGSVGSAVTSFFAIAFSIYVFIRQNKIQKRYSRYYLSKIKQRASDMQRSLELNYQTPGQIWKGIHEKQRDFSDIQRNGLEFAIDLKYDDAINKIEQYYNEYLNDHWIDQNDKTKWLTPTDPTQIQYLNKGAKLCYRTIKGEVEKLNK